ncbi:hypothetical protein JSY14_01720 [Brachybacterium sp. EF45031]|uniref:hypothetical protein n=1 Tax=Brachybacterium sillae TaxID=2810536 RepID=UPI00217CE84D|nr:hypothetical protein [Brachybacterium sillae]MCS6710800.1 hypothetical protein [Brachybacterium sillae]
MTATRADAADLPVLRWLMPPLPVARAARLHRLVAVVVVLDVLLFADDVPAHARSPEFYRPLLLARLLHLPAVTPTLAGILLVVILTAAAMVIAGRTQRIAGAVLAVSFWVWMLWSQSYGYVSHDQMALMVAVAVLPTVPALTSRSERVSRAAGWALRSIQLAVVATYVLSVLAKTLYSGSPAAWANSAIFTWAFIRRGAPWVEWTLQLPWLFVPAQWAVLLMELGTVLALVLRGRALYTLIGIVLLFHLGTLLTLGIHFLPTVVCWAAFLPLEHLRVPTLRRRSQTSPEETPAED